MEQPYRSIYEQLKSLEDRAAERQMRKLISMKTPEEDEFLRVLSTARKKSIV